jgi:DNA replication protein DnaC
MSDLHDRLRRVGLLATSQGLDDIVAAATKHRWSPIQIMEHLIDIEDKDRARRSLDRRTSRSRLGKFKPMADFDWAWPKKIDRELVDSAVRLDFLAAQRNVVFVAPQGLGKTTIAQNIAHQAILAGHSVLFLPAAQLLLDLAAQDSARALDRRLQYYAKVSLLILDEVGYLAFDSRNADLLFQVISRRYERKSLVLTTNLAFNDWPTIFPSATCATALIDRVIHHADVIGIEGLSYRLREAEARTAARTKPPKSKAPTPPPKKK